MKKEKNYNGLIILAVVFVILILGFGVYIFNNKDSSHSDNVNNNLNSEFIDEDLLLYIYLSLGILPKDQNYVNNCLNQAISQNNYQDNAKSIFSWYATLKEMNTYHEDAKINIADGITVSVYNAASTRSISKSSANKIITMYNLKDMSDFLKEMPKPYEDEYYYTSYASQPVICNYDVEHNRNVEYIDSSTVRLTDNQIVTEYEFGSEHISENIKSTKNQTVIYDFTKDNNETYYHLDKVSVE